MLQLIVCSALLLGASDKEAERVGVAQSDVERAARDFRIQVYESYRLDRPEYDARRELGDRLLEGFVAAGSPRAYQEDVLNWFRTSEELSRDGEAVDLPALPALPDPLPGHVAQDDPTQAPHFPGMDRVNIEIPTSATDTGFLGTPTPVDFYQKAKGDDAGVLFETESKILRSIQRALFSPAPRDHNTDHDGASDAKAAGSRPETEQDSTRGVDPFAPRNAGGNKAAAPSLTKPSN